MSEWPIMGVHFKAPKKRERTFGKFPESREQTSGDRIMLIELKNCVQPPKKRPIFSYSDMWSLIPLKYFQKFDGQRKVKLPISLPTSHALPKSGILLLPFLNRLLYSFGTSYTSDSAKQRCTLVRSAWVLCVTQLNRAGIWKAELRMQCWDCKS